MKKQTKQFIFWAPRVLCILFALFISLFALDVFSEGSGFWKTILALIMHLIPTFLILILLLIAWHWEWIGTLAFIGLAVFYGIWTRGEFPFSTYMIMSVPLLLVGFLFMLSWVYNPRKNTGEGLEHRKPLLRITITIILLIIAGMTFLYVNKKPPEITSILQPKDGSEAAFQTPVMGEFTEDLSETDLWLVIQPKDSVRFHPQPGPVMKPPRRMKWYSTAYVGRPAEEDIGEKFIIYLCSATDEASPIFKDYLDKANENHLWPGLSVLPVGITGLDTITVVRK
jgi:hypothetical protein